MSMDEKRASDVEEKKGHGTQSTLHHVEEVSAEEINKIMSKYDKESAVRKLPRQINLVISIILICFSLLQLYSTWRIIPATNMRPLHLGIVVFLAFALYPVRKAGFSSKRGWRISFGIDVTLAVIALFCYLYMAFNYETIAHTAPTRYPTFYYVIGGLGIVLLMEACRRVTGLPIVCVAIAFLLVGFFGQSMPSFLGNKGFDVKMIIKHLFFGLEGVFGTPIGASSTFIFLFMLFGSFLEKTGVGQFFIDFGNALAGHKRGGPAKVAVLTSALEGTVSGSSVANTVGSGSFTIPMMKKLGYPPEFAAAAEASASTGGQIMPPVMGAAAFLMVDALGLEYAVIAKAAIIPAVLYFLGIWFSVDFEARKHGLRGLSREELPSFKRLMIERGYLLLPLIAIIVTLSSGFTPSRAALVGIGMAIVGSYLRTFAELLVLALWGHGFRWITRDPGTETPPDNTAEAVRQVLRNSSGMRWRDYLDALEGGARSIIGVALACGVAGIISGMISLTGVGAKLGASLSELSGNNTFLLLFFTMLTSIILGMGVPTTANYLITSTMMASVVAQALNPGVTGALTGEQLLPAHMFTFYFGIVADITPPVALAAMAGAAIAKSDPLKTGWQSSKCAIGAFVVPYVFALNPQMLMLNVHILDLLLIIVTSMLGMWIISMAVVGYWRVKCNVLERLLAFGGGICMVVPGWQTDLIGLVAGAIVVFWQLQKSKGQTSAKKEPMAL